MKLELNEKSSYIQKMLYFHKKEHLIYYYFSHFKQLNIK